MPDIGTQLPLYWRPFNNDGPIEQLLWDTVSDHIMWDSGETDYLLWN